MTCYEIEQRWGAWRPPCFRMFDWLWAHANSNWLVSRRGGATTKQKHSESSPKMYSNPRAPPVCVEPKWPPHKFSCGVRFVWLTRPPSGRGHCGATVTWSAQSQPDQFQYGGQLGRSTVPVDDIVVLRDQVRRLQRGSSAGSRAATGRPDGSGVHEGSDHLGARRSHVQAPSLWDWSEWKLAVGGVRRGSWRCGRGGWRCAWSVRGGVQPSRVRFPGDGWVRQGWGLQRAGNGGGPTEEHLCGSSWQRADLPPPVCAERRKMGIRGPGQTAGKHRQRCARRLHPALGSGRADSAASCGLRGAENCEPEPALVGPRGALCPPQLWVRGGEKGRQAPGASQEEGKLLGEFLETRDSRLRMRLSCCSGSLM